MNGGGSTTGHLSKISPIHIHQVEAVIAIGRKN